LNVSYDLKENLFKREFIKHRYGKHTESCSQGSESFEVDERTIVKTEFYKDNKLIKTEVHKTP